MILPSIICLAFANSCSSTFPSSCGGGWGSERYRVGFHSTCATEEERGIAFAGNNTGKLDILVIQDLLGVFRTLNWHLRPGLSPKTCTRNIVVMGRRTACVGLPQAAVKRRLPARGSDSMKSRPLTPLLSYNVQLVQWSSGYDFCLTLRFSPYL